MKQLLIASVTNGKMTIEHLVTGSTPEIKKLVNIIYTNKFQDNSETLYTNDHQSFISLLEMNNIQLPFDKSFVLITGEFNKTTFNGVLVFGKEPINLN